MQSKGPNLFTKSRCCTSRGSLKNTLQISSFGGSRGFGTSLLLEEQVEKRLRVKIGTNALEQPKLRTGYAYSSTVLLCGGQNRVGSNARGFATSKATTARPELLHTNTKESGHKKGSPASKREDKNSAVRQESQRLKQQAIDLHEGELSFFGFRDEPTLKGKVAFLWKFGKEIGTKIWHGFKDLWRNFVEANKLRKKRREGAALTRKEERFIRQNVKDLKNLVPFFLVWRIPIFGDFILPFFIAKFPYLLPSTFKLVRTPRTEERVGANKLKQLSLLGEVHRGTFDPEMLEKVHQSLPLSRPITVREVIENADLLDSSFSVKDLNRNQLAALCSVLNLGTRTIAFFLRVWYYKHMTYIRHDDQVLKAEGTQSLSEQDLIDACLERGLKVLGLTKEQLQNQLTAWIELSSQQPKVLTPLLVYAHTYEQRDLWLQTEEKSPK